MYIIKDWTDDSIIGIYDTYAEAVNNLLKNLYCEQYGSMVTYCICSYDVEEQEKEYKENLEYQQYLDFLDYQDYIEIQESKWWFLYNSYPELKDAILNGEISD